MWCPLNQSFFKAVIDSQEPPNWIKGILLENIAFDLQEIDKWHKKFPLMSIFVQFSGMSITSCEQDYSSYE